MNSYQGCIIFYTLFVLYVFLLFMFCNLICCFLCVCFFGGAVQGGGATQCTDSVGVQ